MPHTPEPSCYGEPLRDLRLVEALRVSATSENGGPRLRTGIVDRLMVAQTLLPRALKLLVIAGHHGPAENTRCPHTTAHQTGGAVDLTTYQDGEPEPKPWSPEPPPAWPLVATALTDVGMVNGTTWWHWSFGDPQWRDQSGATAVLYGVVE